MKKIITFIFCLFFLGNTSFSQNISLVKDIKAGLTSSLDSFFDPIVFDGVIYFIADDGTNGKELWKTDGTEAGTFLVKDIYVGSTSSSIGDLTVFKGELYFRARETGSYNLWKTDGTTSGTIKWDFVDAFGNSFPKFLTVFNNELYFYAFDATVGGELRKTDGTEVGTVLVKEINLSGSSDIEQLTIFNGELYFIADDNIHGQELWKTDGTEVGTVLVKDVFPGASNSSIKYLTVSGNTLYFTANNGVDNIELWKTNGTEAGTELLKDINGTGGSFPDQLTDLNGTLIFQAYDNTNGVELWKSDGTTAGTVLVTDLNPGLTSSFPFYFKEYNNELYFKAENDATVGVELWKTDGTAVGTVLVKDINPGVGNSSPEYFKVFNGKLYFNADNGTEGSELWETDGTTIGTLLTKDIRSGGSSSNPFGFQELNGKLYFYANDIPTGKELFKLSFPNTFTMAAGNWNEAANWSFGVVPVANDDVEIPAGKIATINVSNLEVVDIHISGELNINSGKSITAKGNLVADTGTLKIHSNVTSNGTLIVKGRSSGTITYNRFVTGIDTAPDPDIIPWHLITSPLVGETIQDVIANGTLANGSVAERKGLATYNNTTVGNPWTYLTTASTGTINSGNGFSALRASDGTIPFTGILKVDDLESYVLTIGDLGGGVENPWNLIGNPYPSFIAANNNADATTNFLATNIGQMNPFFAGLYFWNSTTKLYEVVNNATIGAKYIAPGQAFFVASKAGGGTITITEAMQKHQAGNLFVRTANDNPQIVLSVTNGTVSSSTEIKYIEGTTTGLDAGYDAGLFNGTATEFSVFTNLITNGNETAIALQCLPPTNYETMIVPVGLKSNENTTVTFSVNTRNLPDNIFVYLEDRKLQSFIRLDEDNSNYQVQIDSAIKGIGRFYIHTTQQKVLSTDGFTNISEIAIYKTSNSSLRITGLRQKGISIKIINMLGKQVLKKEFSSNGVSNINLPKTLSSGIYIVQLQTQYGKKTKKISIQ